MIDYYGRWTAEKDYTVYPKEKWCDLDHVAAWIRNSSYNIKTSIENLVEIVMCHYIGYLRDNNVQFYIDDMKQSENDVMISIKDLSCFVENNGGLNEFDYEC